MRSGFSVGLRLSLMEDDLAAVGVENDGKTTDWRLGNSPSKRRAALLEARNFRIQIRNLESQHCAANWHGVLIAKVVSPTSYSNHSPPALCVSFKPRMSS